MENKTNTVKSTHTEKHTQKTAGPENKRKGREREQVGEREGKNDKIRPPKQKGLKCMKVKSLILRYPLSPTLNCLLLIGLLLCSTSDGFEVCYWSRGGQRSNDLAPL